MVRAPLNWLESCVLQWWFLTEPFSSSWESLVGWGNQHGLRVKKKPTYSSKGVCVCVCVTKVQEDARGCLCCRERKRAKWWEKEKWRTQENRTTKPWRSYWAEGIDWVDVSEVMVICVDTGREIPESPLWERDIEKSLKTKLLGRPWDTLLGLGEETTEEKFRIWFFMKEQDFKDKFQCLLHSQKIAQYLLY